MESNCIYRTDNVKKHIPLSKASGLGTSLLSVWCCEEIAANSIFPVFKIPVSILYTEYTSCKRWQEALSRIQLDTHIIFRLWKKNMGTGMDIKACSFLWDQVLQVQVNFYSHKKQCNRIAWVLPGTSGWFCLPSGGLCFHSSLLS